MPDDCLFCKIADGAIPAKIVYQDDDLLAFEDIDPKAPFHVLIIPRRHISTLNDVQQGDEALVGSLITRAARNRQGPRARTEWLSDGIQLQPRRRGRRCSISTCTAGRPEHELATRIRTRADVFRRSPRHRRPPRGAR